MNGYTLIELLITLSIISILGLCSLSLTRSFVENNQQSIQVYALVNAIEYTRMAAIRNNALVNFCGSSDLKTCDGDWEQSQIVKIKDQVLRVFPGVSSGSHLFFQSSFGKNDSLSFSPLGFTHGQQGSFYYVSGSQKKTYRVIVSHTGTVRVEEEKKA